MITEFVEIEITPGKEQDFIAGVETSRAIFARTKGCHGIELHHSIEAPQHFILNVKWESTNAHSDFRNSPDAPIWRGNVSTYFAGTPKIWHSKTVVS